ncbi:MAG: hypothetical protein FWE23_06405 [Chitinivibrionia bacterium]|nr:hypothetical protein [Chitinivibrionia bacterium]
MSVDITPKAKKATVVFTTPSVDGAAGAILTGEWDNWEVWAMKKGKDGAFSVKLNLDLGRAYQFGYSIDGRWNSDATLPQVVSPFGTSNSVLDLTNVVAPEEAAPKKEAAATATKTAAPKAAAATKKTTAKAAK